MVCRLSHLTIRVLQLRELVTKGELNYFTICADNVINPYILCRSNMVDPGSSQPIDDRIQIESAASLPLLNTYRIVAVGYTIKTDISLDGLGFRYEFLKNN